MKCGSYSLLVLLVIIAVLCKAAYICKDRHVPPWAVVFTAHCYKQVLQIQPQM